MRELSALLVQSRHKKYMEFSERERNLCNSLIEYYSAIAYRDREGMEYLIGIILGVGKKKKWIINHEELENMVIDAITSITSIDFQKMSTDVVSKKSDKILDTYLLARGARYVIERLKQEGRTQKRNMEVLRQRVLSGELAVSSSLDDVRDDTLKETGNPLIRMLTLLFGDTFNEKLIARAVEEWQSYEDIAKQQYVTELTTHEKYRQEFFLHLFIAEFLLKRREKIVCHFLNFQAEQGLIHRWFRHPEYAAALDKKELVAAIRDLDKWKKKMESIRSS